MTDNTTIWEQMCIKLEKEVWYPGQILQGYVTIANSENVKFQAIRLVLKGEGHVEWKIQRGIDWRTIRDSTNFLTCETILCSSTALSRHNSMNDTSLNHNNVANIVDALPSNSYPATPYNNSNNYHHPKCNSNARQIIDPTSYSFNQSTTTTSASSSATTAPILPRGEHRWKFQFPLADNHRLPCSFESRTGYVRYSIRLIIDLPYLSSPNYVHYFTLIGPRIDCMESRFLDPVHREVIPKPICWLCTPIRKPIRLSAQLERSAYCSGEQIRLRCRVYNGEDRSCRLWVRLIQRSCFVVSRGVVRITRQLLHTAIEYTGELIISRTDQTVDLSRFLRVPPLPPTIDSSVSKLFEVAYRLRVSLVPKSPARGLGQIAYSKNKTQRQNTFIMRQTYSRKEQIVTIEIPVTIATTPFRIPNTPSASDLTISYCPAIEEVEGGNYISPEFCEGQVYDGTCESDNEETVVYRPVYVFVASKYSSHTVLYGDNVSYETPDCEQERCMEKISSV